MNDKFKRFLIREGAMSPPDSKMSEPELVEAVGVLQDLYYKIKPEDPEAASVLNRVISYLTADVRKRNRY